MRLERRQAKLAAKGITEDASKLPKAPANQEKSLSDYIEEAHENPRHKLTVSMFILYSFENINLHPFLAYSNHDYLKVMNFVDPLIVGCDSAIQ